MIRSPWRGSDIPHGDLCMSYDRVRVRLALGGLFSMSVYE